MLFLELILENFGPYGGKQIINLNPNFEENNTPIILFGGMNGGGKTTLMDAIRLALYGNRAQCSTRNNLSYADFLKQCVNRGHYNDKTRIELEFEIVEDGKQKFIRVVRNWTIKDDKDTLGVLVSEKGDLDQWKDEALSNIWDEYIENLLPLGISNLFLFDGEQVKELAELDIPPASVITAIQSLLGLELAEKLNQDLEVLVNRKRKEIANTEQLGNLQQIEQKLNDQYEESDLNAKELQELQEKLRNANNQQKEVMNKFIYEGGKIASDRSFLQQKKDDLTQEAENYRQQLRNLASGSLPLGIISGLLETTLIQTEKELHIEQQKMSIDVIMARDNKFFDYITSLELSSEYVSKIKYYFQGENKKLELEVKNFVSWLNTDIETKMQLEKLVKYEIKANIDQGDSHIGILEKIEREIESLERQIAAAPSTEVYEKLENAVKIVNDELAKIKAECELKTQRGEQLKKEIIKTKKELHEYAEQSISLKDNEHLVNSVSKVKDTLKVFKEKLTLKKLNKLETEVTECFKYLLHKSDLVNKVVIGQENFSISLYDFQGKLVPKHRLSAGEKQLLAVAFLWGLARVSGRNLPVAIDTPLGRLDSSHRSNLVERYFPAASHQVILLSTDTEITEIELKKLREQKAIAAEYLLKYDINQRQTVVENGYFW